MIDYRRHFRHGDVAALSTPRPEEDFRRASRHFFAFRFLRLAFHYFFFDISGFARRCRERRDIVVDITRERERGLHAADVTHSTPLTRRATRVILTMIKMFVARYALLMRVVVHDDYAIGSADDNGCCARC